MIKKISYIVVLLVVFNCKNDQKNPKGFFLDSSKSRIYEFKDFSLNIYDLPYSKKVKYETKFSNDSIKLYYDNEIEKYKFSSLDNRLTLDSCRNYDFANCKINLEKIYIKNLNIKHLYNSYWGASNKNDSIYYLLKIPENNQDFGYLYFRNNIEFNSLSNKTDFFPKDKFSIEHEIYFNKFHVLKLDSFVFDNRWFYIIFLSTNELHLKDVDSETIIKFKKNNNPNIINFDKKLFNN